MKIHCCACTDEVDAKLIYGDTVYPHRHDLRALPFWQCPTCKNWVGCHHKTNTPTQPLGCIPTPELKKARQHIHALVDPLWQNQKIHRKHLYNKISKRLGYKYHTAEIKTIDEAREIYAKLIPIVKEIRDNA